MKIGVIGFGSIGKRHVNNLITLGYNDIFLLRTKETGNNLGLVEYTDINSFLDNKFDFVIIANPTSEHFNCLKILAGLNTNILVEKPIVNTLEEVLEMQSILANYKGVGMVGYNTRFHPCIGQTQEILDSGTIGKPLYANFFIGQYLPDWRPGVDYSESVSAKKSLGGGVASELIHEIDLGISLFGSPKGIVNSIITKISDLKIETEDISDYQYISTRNVMVHIHTNYLYRGYKRTFEIMGSEANLMCDLFTSKIVITGKTNNIIDEINFNDFQRNDMYLSMIKHYIECVEEKKETKIPLITGLESSRIVEIAKKTNKI